MTVWIQAYRAFLLLFFLLLLDAGCAAAEKKNGATQRNIQKSRKKKKVPMALNPLTPEEERIILHKGTEPPSTTETISNQPGTWLCRQCNAPLYRAADKFESHCGWPSFDDEIPHAVRRVPDADGRRTEIVCSACGGHLGHVFQGENLTPKNTRHCVNSLSIRRVPFVVRPGQKVARALFASGCFWGTQYHFKQQPGVLYTRVGYSGGKTPNPTYKQVCTGRTGHAETVEVWFDPEIVSYTQLVRLFFETHDFTQVNRQGPDVGTQYRSAIFYLGAEQKRLAEQVREQLKKRKLSVATEIVPAGLFYPAEAYHQDYYQRTGGKPYCHRRVRRFSEP